MAKELKTHILMDRKRKIKVWDPKEKEESKKMMAKLFPKPPENLSTESSDE